MDFFKAIKGQGVDIRIFTKPINQQYGEMAYQAGVAIEQLRNIGVIVSERRNMHQKIAILDNNISWEGSLNILSHRDTEEQMRRFVGEKCIDEIIRNLELDNEYAEGNISNEKCPRCGRPMIIRKGKYGMFLSCLGFSTSKCKETINIRTLKAIKAEN